MFLCLPCRFCRACGAGFTILPELYSAATAKDGSAVLALLKSYGRAGETMQLGCMHLNSLLSMTEVSLDHKNDGAWMELLMGQGKIIEPEDTLANASREVLLLRHEHPRPRHRTLIRSRILSITFFRTIFLSLVLALSCTRTYGLINSTQDSQQYADIDNTHVIATGKMANGAKPYPGV